ncbi:MAG TPA: universal stress protein [Burkholderiaceae bacterium]|nr:universal stress protein [Burkholderiaceae bacterium]
MYRHLLVPIDDTDLSVEVVGNAVALARALAARITFFHAVPDTAAALLDGDAEVLRATARDDYDYAYRGKAGELLAKAEAAARALGVPCAARQAVSDRPAQALIDAARSAGCDLIFMASHGHRGKLGMAFASETLAVLMNSGLPVLVSSTGELPPPARAIGIIRDEHRSLAAVMHAWMDALAEARRADAAADPALMRAIVHYLQQFPLQLHHPKEDAHLFARLRERTTSCNAELDELHRQHERDTQLVAALAQRVGALEGAADAQARTAATRALEVEVSGYARFLWDHLGREEGVILPAAQRHLLASDWAEIDAAFAENRDPAAGATDKELRHLFSRIVNHAVA